MRIFRDRTDAGRRLAEKLLDNKPQNPLVLSLPRGGVPVGYEVASSLSAPFDTVVVRKIGAPGNRELGVGAIAPGGVLALDTERVKMLGIEREDLEHIIKQEVVELGRRITKYRSGEFTKSVEPDTVIVVDDGLATGVTARAALEYSHMFYKPKHLIFASPVCALDAIPLIRDYVDEVVCIFRPPDLSAISQWYDIFTQVSDGEVLELLEKGAHK
jgi:putative phosphoribosyl transferase